jgi:putative restriction endonuclease
MADIEPNSDLTKEDIEEIFDYGFGFQIRGINRVTDDKGDLESILVFSKKDGPYDDAVEGKKFTYWGEIQNGDYKTAYNKGLIKSMIKDIPVHFFHKESSDEKWHYIGDVDVIGVEETEDRQGRTNYKFDLER